MRPDWLGTEVLVIPIGKVIADSSVILTEREYNYKILV
jgi:hypothetical protein